MNRDRAAKNAAVLGLALVALAAWLTAVYLTVRVIRAAWGGN